MKKLAMLVFAVVLVSVSTPATPAHAGRFWRDVGKITLGGAGALLLYDVVRGSGCYGNCGYGYGGNYIPAPMQYGINSVNYPVQYVAVQPQVQYISVQPTSAPDPYVQRSENAARAAEQASTTAIVNIHNYESAVAGTAIVAMERMSENSAAVEEVKNQAIAKIQKTSPPKKKATKKKVVYEHVYMDGL